MNGFDAYKKHINPVLAELEDLAGISRRFVRAEGCNLWDEAGNCYLDFISSHGSQNLGHNAVPMLVMRDLLKNRIITQICGHNWNVLKIEPPLVVDKNDIDRFVDAVDEAVEWIGSII